MIRALSVACAMLALVTASSSASAQFNQPAPGQMAYASSSAPAYGGYTADEIINTGHGFFGEASRSVAALVERAFEQYGQPNGYVLGEEAGGALVAGVRYGEGLLNTKTGGSSKVYWQGPSLGYDFGADGARTMILVYNLTGPDALHRRYLGVAGSAYLIGGIGMTVLTRADTLIVPIRTGVGLRLGANVGYLKFSANPTWNPF